MRTTGCAGTGSTVSWCAPYAETCQEMDEAGESLAPGGGTAPISAAVTQADALAIRDAASDLQKELLILPPQALRRQVRKCRLSLWAMTVV